MTETANPASSAAPVAPPLTRRLGPRLLAAILLASTALAMVATAIQLYLDYQRDVDELEEQFAVVERTFGDSLASSLWSLDKRQLQLQLDGLLRLRDLQFARVQGRLGERFVAGGDTAQGMVSRDFVLRAPTGAREPIGTLTVGIGLGGVYQRLVDRALVIFVTQAAKAALIALLILFIVRRWVTRHLETMAAHARALTMAGLERPLTLPRSAGAPPDELDEVANALNEMSASLARELGARTAAQTELRRHHDLLEELVRRRTAELLEAKDRAESANRAKSAFLSRMSHELRTPLNAILGYAQLLRMDSSVSPRVAAGLDVVRSSGEHLLALIVDILDLSRIEAGRVELYPAELEVRPFVQSVADILRVKVDEKRLQLRTEVADDVPATVIADERRLRQILLNLVGNAVKFTDEGGITLRVRRAGSPSLALGFEVSDTGIGIAAEDRERIFEPFEQGGDLHRRRAGTGLGLAISRQLVRQMGSDIVVQAGARGGSVFRFEAARSTGGDAPGTRPAAAVPRRYEGARRTVLVVDDTPGNRSLLRELLGESGFHVLEAADGSQALTELDRCRVDLVLMDMAMPVMDGLEATRQIRLHPRHHALPVIAVSAHASQVDESRCIDAGANGYVSKPIDPATLFGRIGGLLDLRWTA